MAAFYLISKQTMRQRTTTHNKNDTHKEAALSVGPFRDYKKHHKTLDEPLQ